MQLKKMEHKCTPPKCQTIREQKEMGSVHFGFLDDRREASLSDPDTLIYVQRSKPNPDQSAARSKYDGINQPADAIIPAF